jgi:hypothetical protein
VTIPVDQTSASYNLPASVIDFLTVVVQMPNNGSSVANIDLTVDRISRDYYLNIPNKTTTGRPVQYTINRMITPVLYLWPTPDQEYDLIVDRLVRMDDAASGVNTVQVPFRFYPCLAAGLAYYIAMKKAPDRIQLLKAAYEEEFDRAMSEDRDRASLTLTPVRDWYRVV